MLWLLQILSSTHPLDTVVERCVNWNNKHFCEFFFFSEEHLPLPVNFPARQRFSLVLAAYHIRAFPSYHGSLRLSFQCRSQGLSSSCPVDLLSLQSAKKRDPANEVVVGCSRQENEMIQNWACFRFFCPRSQITYHFSLQAHENLHAAIMQNPENLKRISWWKECRQPPVIRDRSKLWMEDCVEKIWRFIVQTISRTPLYNKFIFI